MQKALQRKKRELKALPEGSLVKKNGCYYHYCKGHEAGISKNKELIKKLARKRFLEKEIEIISKNQELQKRYKNKYEALNIKHILASMPKSYQELPLEFFVGKEMQTAQSENPYKREHLIYKSGKGVFVRTKSELIIANFLEDNKINYLYEPRFMLGRHVVYPDFLLENVHDHTVMPLEHLGMLGAVEYDEKAFTKITKYTQNGYFPSRDIIYTYEDDIMDPEKLRNILQLHGFI